MLNAKQEKFINNIVAGMSQRQAYKDAYNATYDDDAIDNKASKLFNKAEVQARYKELMGQLEDKAIMSAKERMKWLTEVINGIQTEESKYFSDGECIVYEKTADLNTKIKALDTLNKMSGEYTTKIEADVSVKKLEDLL
ncbi:MAG: terminase small subunit [Intestinibacter sp.]